MPKVQIRSQVEIDHSDEGWVEFKKWLDGTYAILRYVWVDEGEAYNIIAIDGPVCRICGINKGSSDATDFETNFKNYEVIQPLSSEGRMIVAPTYMDTAGAKGHFEGNKWLATAGAQSFFDILVTTQIYVQGGTYWCENAEKGDYAEFSIVDKDDVLGLFALYGLTVGVDVLVLEKYVKTEYMHEGRNEGDIEVTSKGDVFPGLYLRASYVSIGSVDVDMAVRYKWYEV